MNNNLSFQSHHNCKSNNLPIWSHWQILRPSSFYLQPHNTKDELSLSLNFGNIYWKCVDSLLSLTLLRVTRLECAAVSKWRFKLRNSLTLQLCNSENPQFLLHYIGTAHENPRKNFGFPVLRRRSLAVLKFRVILGRGGLSPVLGLVGQIPNCSCPAPLRLDSFLPNLEYWIQCSS